MATEWSSLPDEVWQIILGKVSLYFRLGPCSTVCKKLYRAAAAATDTLQLNCHRRPQRSQGFRDWLYQHGRHVRDLRLTRLVGALTVLPCQHLRQLKLEECDVQLGTSHGHPGILSCCPALERLELKACKLADSSVGLAAFAAVPALQRLELAELKAPQRNPAGPGLFKPDDSVPDHFELAADVLMPLTQLTSLALWNGVRVMSASLQHISCLQQLQELELYEPEAEISPSSTPGLMRLSALICLKLYHAALDPAVLCGCTQLQCLQLHFVTFLGAHDATALLSLIGRQQQLQQLSLTYFEGMQSGTAAAYTALTASSKLRSLYLGPGDLSADMWQAVFRPAQQLPYLQECIINHVDYEYAEYAGAPPLSTADVKALVSCCPGLRDLRLLVQPDAQLTALSQLPALTAVELYSGTAAPVQYLAALTGLQRVEFENTMKAFRCPLDTAELLMLTSLQQLTQLVVWHKSDVVLALFNKSPPNDAPDVWQQLLERCK